MHVLARRARLRRRQSDTNRLRIPLRLGLTPRMWMVSPSHVSPRVASLAARSRLECRHHRSRCKIAPVLSWICRLRARRHRPPSRSATLPGHVLRSVAALLSRRHRRSAPFSRRADGRPAQCPVNAQNGGAALRLRGAPGVQC